MLVCVDVKYKNLMFTVVGLMLIQVFEVKEQTFAGLKSIIYDGIKHHQHTVQFQLSDQNKHIAKATPIFI